MLLLRKIYNILGGGAVIIPGSGCIKTAFCGPILDQYGRVGEQNHVYSKELYLTILTKWAINILSCCVFTVYILPSLQQTICVAHPGQNAPKYFIYLQHVSAQLGHYHGVQHKMT
jgi:hypothetical protein